MAMSRKGSHEIQVDGQTYRWRVSTGEGLHRLRVELAETPGQLLTVEIPAAPDPGLQFSLEQTGQALDPVPPGAMGAIKRGLVEQAIRFALANGWDPGPSRRRRAIFEYRNHRFQFQDPARKARGG